MLYFGFVDFSCVATGKKNAKNFDIVQMNKCCIVSLSGKVLNGTEKSDFTSEFCDLIIVVYGCIHLADLHCSTGKCEKGGSGWEKEGVGGKSKGFMLS